MKILDRYILKEQLVPFGLGLCIFTTVFLLNRLVQLMELIVTKGVTVVTALALVGHLMPAFLVLVIPSAVLLASLLSFGRLAADGELAALGSAGVSLYRMLVPVIAFAGACALITAYSGMYLLPRSNMSFKKLLYDLVRRGSLLELKEHKFIDGFKGLVIYVDNVSPEGNRLRGVLIADRRHADKPYLIMAQQGRLQANPEQGNFTIELQEGRIQNLNLGSGKTQEVFRELNFGGYRLNINLDEYIGRKKSRKRAREKTITELQQTILKRQQAGKECYTEHLEIHKRFALPVSALLIALVGAALGYRSRTANTSAGFTLSLGVIFLYYSLFRAGDSLAELGKLSPVIAMWGPNFLLALVGIYLVRKSAQGAPIPWLDWMPELLEKLSRVLRRTQ